MLVLGKQFQICNHMWVAPLTRWLSICLRVYLRHMHPKPTLNPRIKHHTYTGLIQSWNFKCMTMSRSVGWRPCVGFRYAYLSTSYCKVPVVAPHSLSNWPVLSFWPCPIQMEKNALRTSRFFESGGRTTQAYLKTALLLAHAYIKCAWRNGPMTCSHGN